CTCSRPASWCPASPLGRSSEPRPRRRSEDPEPGVGWKEDRRMTTWRRTRRWVAWAAPALALVLAVGLTLPATAQAPVQLRFMSWYFGEDPAGPALKTLFAEFEKRNPNIKIVAEQVTSAERVPKFTAAMEAGRGPDIYMDTPPNAPNLIVRGYCTNLEPL